MYESYILIKFIQVKTNIMVNKIFYIIKIEKLSRKWIKNIGEGQEKPANLVKTRKNSVKAEYLTKKMKKVWQQCFERRTFQAEELAAIKLP